jgi:hypothetical protein
MQRSLLPNLLKAFPTVQFIVATHSPFMVSAVHDSLVYVLKYQDQEGQASSAEPEDPAAKRAVISVKLDTVNKAGNASQILKEVLGVEATVPEWVEADLERITQNFRGREITPESLNELRGALSTLGYSHLYPSAVAKLLNRGDQVNETR